MTPRPPSDSECSVPSPRNVVAVLALTAFALGCDSENAGSPTSAEDPVYALATSPEAVMDNLTTALEAREMAPYERTLAEDYAFYRPPADDFGFTFLGKDTDLSSTGTMFGSVGEIEFEIAHDGAVPSTHDDFPASAGYLEINGTLTMTVTDATSRGDPVIYRVDGQRVDFIFAADDASTPTTYSIIHVQDWGSEERASATRDVSWTAIKDLFR